MQVETPQHAGRPDQQSSAAALRTGTLARARCSFSFFVRAVLGRRRLRAERLEALARGEAAPSVFEAKLLERWKRLRDGEIPQELEWAGGGFS